MVETRSRMLPLGKHAPGFSLPDTKGGTVSKDDFEGRPLLVMFICNHCPFVKHIREKLAELTAVWREKGVGVVAINANDIENYPQDSPAKMKEEKASCGYGFPYLFDETQKVAQSYKAACTPDFFLFDQNHRLVYRGQFDDSRPGSEIPVTGSDLTEAVEAVLEDKSVPQDQKPSIGCNIKWKKGNEPEYMD